MYENEWKARICAFIYILIVVSVVYIGASYFLRADSHEQTTVQSIREQQQESIERNQTIQNRVEGLSENNRRAATAIRTSEKRLERAEELLRESERVFTEIRKGN